MALSDIYMSDERYLAALYRQRDRIIAGTSFEADDSDVIGDKYTHASWGLCSREKEAWPDAQDHLWPDQFTKHGRVAPKYRNEHQACPMQRKGGGSGCFYSCRIFKSGEITARKRAQAIELYEQKIGNVRGQIEAHKP
jgi:hypothetical protein